MGLVRLLDETFDSVDGFVVLFMHFIVAVFDKIVEFSLEFFQLIRG